MAIVWAVLTCATGPTTDRDRADCERGVAARGPVRTLGCRRDGERCRAGWHVASSCRRRAGRAASAAGRSRLTGRGLGYAGPALRTKGQKDDQLHPGHATYQPDEAGRDEA